MTKWIMGMLVIAQTLNANPNLSVAQSMTTQQMIAAGKESSANRCSGCHGETGEGNGPAAAMLDPKPRNLVAGAFKLRSTPMGTLPTVADPVRTLDQGIPGTSMPSFKDVAEAEKLSIVAYIRSLRPDFQETRSAQVSISIPPPPADFFQTKAGVMAAAKKGRVHYEKNCLPCHGENGRGDGLSAEGMVDSDDRPIKPANLAKTRLKSGSTARDVFKAISTGLDGAPMPAYAEALNETQRWEVVAYIFYLRGREAEIYSEGDTLK